MRPDSPPTSCAPCCARWHHPARSVANESEGRSGVGIARVGTGTLARPRRDSRLRLSSRAQLGTCLWSQQLWIGDDEESDASISPPVTGACAPRILAGCSVTSLRSGTLYRTVFPANIRGPRKKRQ